MAEPTRILLIRPSALGDVCRTVPVLASLRAEWPDAQIDWLVNDAFAPAIASHPALNNAIPFPRKSFGAWWNPASAPAFFKWLRMLRRRNYDLVIDCQGLARSGLMSRATGAKTRVGYANASEFGWLGYNRRLRVDRAAHAVDRMLALLEPIGAPAIPDMRLYSNDADRSSVDQMLGASTNDRLAVIAPTSRWEAKRWPAERFAQLTQSILNDNLADRVAIVGAPGEQPQCKPITSLAAGDPRIIDLVGKCTVGELLAVIERSCLVVANDSAALHIAVGFDKPIVALFGPTDVALVGPYQRESTVLQKLDQSDKLDHKNDSLGAKIMSRITVDDALQAAERALIATEPAQSAGKPA